MASITIKNLDNVVKKKLSMRAAKHGWSIEREAQEILQKTLFFDTGTSAFAERIHRRFFDLELENLDIPPRRLSRNPSVTE